MYLKITYCGICMYENTALINYEAALIKSAFEFLDKTNPYKWQTYLRKAGILENRSLGRTCFW